MDNLKTLPVILIIDTKPENVRASKFHERMKSEPYYKFPVDVDAEFWGATFVLVRHGDIGDHSDPSDYWSDKDIFYWITGMSGKMKAENKELVKHLEVLFPGQDFVDWLEIDEDKWMYMNGEGSEIDEQNGIENGEGEIDDKWMV